MIQTLILLAVVIFFALQRLAAAPFPTEIQPSIEPTPTPESTPVPTSVPEPAPTFDPRSKFKPPKLWPYNADQSYDIWIARNYKEYIMPDSEIVKYFAENVYLYEDPDSEWIARKGIIPRFTWIREKYEGNDKPRPSFKYVPDKDQFNQDDYWINPDYYIYNGFEGDCEDYALLWASVFEIWKVPYMIVGGYMNGARDTYIEFKYNNKKYRAQVQMGMVEIDAFVPAFTFRPVQMFNKTTTIQTYNPNWG